MEYLLQVKRIDKSFGDYKILEKVSFHIKPGEILGLVGRNGTGKTTLMKSILGLVNIDSGQILYKGVSDYTTKKKLMDEIGYLLDCRLFENMNAYENIKIQEWYRGIYRKKNEEKKAIENILNLVGMDNNKKRVKEYSFGMKQRLGLALALLGDTNLLILDEPFVGLDPVGIQTIRDFILSLCRNRKIAVIISSHQLSEIEGMCDRYLFISNRQVANYVDDNTKNIYIYTRDVLSDEAKTYLSSMNAKVEDQKISFLYKETSLNNVLGYLTANNIVIVDIDVKKESIEKLFEGECHA